MMLSLPFLIAVGGVSVVLFFLSCIVPIMDRLEPDIAEGYVRVALVISLMGILTSVYWLPLLFAAE